MGGDPAIGPHDGSSEYDALASLFLGDEPGLASHTMMSAGSPRATPHTPPASFTKDTDDPNAKRQTTGLMLEALVLGHLPVMASPWVPQYAAAMSREKRAAIALARFRSNQLSVEVFGLGDRRGALRVETSLAAAIDSAAAVVDHWIVQVDEIDEPILACDARLSAVTLLAGANSHAIVAAYQTIKGLTYGEGTDASELAHERIKAPLCVAIMGADAEQAAAAMAKLKRAASVFLHRDVELVATVSKMTPTDSVAVYRGAAELGAEEMIDSVVSASARSTEFAPLPFRREESAEKTVSARDVLDHDEEAALRADVAVDPANLPDAAFASAFEPEWDEARFVENTASEVSGLVDEPGVRDGELSEEDVVRFLPGLSHFAARCPDEPDVLLGIDGGGRLHLVRYDRDQRGVEPLVSVAAWARKHAALLAMAAPGVTPLSDGDVPVLHLLTPTPKRVRHLLDAEVRVHVLAPVRVGEQTGWYCDELN